MGKPEQDLLLRPTRSRYGVLAFACSLSLITYLDRICIMRVREDMERDLGFSATDMGLVFAAFVLGYALFEVPGGWMGDRWGSRRVLTRIVLCWSLFTALTGCVLPFAYDTGRSLSLFGWVMPIVLDSLLLMLLVRFLFGAGEAGAYPNLCRVAGDWFPVRERGGAMGAIWMSARLGGAFAPFIIGRLTAALGWREAFWIFGCIGVVWAVFFWRWFRDRPEQHPACNAAELDHIRGPVAPREGITATPHSAHTWPGLGALLRSLTVWGMCSASFWVCFGWYFFPTWQPRYLKEVFGFLPDGWASEVLTGLPFACGAVGALSGGKLSDRLVRLLGSPRWGRSLVGVGGFAGAGLCVLLAGYAQSAWVSVTLLCLAAVSNDLAIPPIWAACADVGGRFAGSVSGLMNTVGAVGAIITSALLPRVLDALPSSYSDVERWRFIFTGLAGAWLLAALSWLFVDAGSRLDLGDKVTR